MFSNVNAQNDSWGYDIFQYCSGNHYFSSLSKLAKANPDSVYCIELWHETYLTQKDTISNYGVTDSFGVYILKDLPLYFYKFKNLRYLRLSGNALSASENNAVFSAFKKLEVLDLEGDDLISLPINFLKDSLRCISLVGNPIEHLPNDISFPKNLMLLNLFATKIDVLPDSIFSLKNIRVLALGDGKNSIFDKRILKFKELKRLKLGNCRIRKLPRGFKKLKLNTLDISGTRIHSIKNIDFTEMNKLYTTDFQISSKQVKKIKKMNPAIMIYEDSGEYKATRIRKPFWKRNVKTIDLHKRQ
jgi:Leucine-rich repeat (LRR) protein